MTILAVIVTAIVCIAGGYAAFSGSEKSETVTVTGSTTVQPLMVEMQSEFQKYTNITLNITGGGSGVGAKSAMDGTADIGMLSRDLSSSESSLTSTTIAKDAVVIIVDKKAGVTNLTIDQLAKIYSGTYTDWSQVGGVAGAIKPVIREEGSGTRDCLDTILGGVSGFSKDKYNTYSTQASTGAMLQQVTNVSGGIGYINLGALSEIDASKITSVSVNGITPSSSTVLNGTYALSRNLILATKGTPQGAPAALINWILSPQGQKMVGEFGFVPLR
jgi:phosphate transport system substrate-binding protein